MEEEVDLKRRLVVSLLALVLVMAAVLFLAAGTLRYWQALLFLAVFGLTDTFIAVYLLQRDPHLLAKRLKAGPTEEPEAIQKAIQSFAGLAFVLVIVVPALDHRFGWSHVPPVMSVLGDIVMAVGMLLVLWVFRCNSNAFATIEVEQDQRLATTGPYRLVRHPMYAFSVLMVAAIPAALGSWWGYTAVALMLATIIWRLLAEERTLCCHLPGYGDYMRETPYRLVPRLW